MEDTMENQVNRADQGKIIEIASANLRNLIARLGLTPEKLAERVHVDSSEVIDYCEGKTMPSASFLLALKDKFEISIDDFISRTDTPEEIYLEILKNHDSITAGSENYRALYESEDPEEIRRLCGSYFVYYLDTENYKGKDINPADVALNYGILTIREAVTVTGKLDFDCIAFLGRKDRKMVRELKEKFDSKPYARDLIAYLMEEDYGKYIYYGRVSASKDHYYISMAHEREDRLSIILHRPNTRKPEYIGGIGTVNSVSRGRQHMPTVQFMGLSRYSLNLSEEDIHHAMLLNYPNYHAGPESDEMIRTFKNLYMNDENTGFMFTDTQRELLIQSNLERIIKESLTRNLMRYAKVSEVDDDDWYHIIKYYGIEKHSKGKK